MVKEATKLLYLYTYLSPLPLPPLPRPPLSLSLPLNKLAHPFVLHEHITSYVPVLLLCFTYVPIHILLEMCSFSTVMASELAQKNY